MKNSILVASPDTAFCEQIRSNLEEGGRYNVQVALSAREAIRFANRKYFDLAVVDGELNDMPIVQFTHGLIGLQPAMKILLYPPENNPQHLSVLGANVNGYLRKPFFAPEISHYLKDLLRPEYGLQSLINEPETEPANIWLQNPDQLKMLLETLLSQTSAYSCLMCLKGQAVLEVGEISAQVTQNVTAFLNHYWVNYENQEIFRYMRMDADTSVVLLYSLPVHGGASLTLLYPPAIQIKQVRSEARRLRDAYIRQRMNMPSYTAAMDTSITTDQRIERAETDPEILEGYDEESEILSLSDILGENEVRSLNQLLENMPVPDPDSETSDESLNGWQPAENAPAPEAQAEDGQSMLFAPAEMQHAEEGDQNPVEEIPSAEDLAIAPAEELSQNEVGTQKEETVRVEPAVETDEVVQNEPVMEEIQGIEPSPIVDETVEEPASFTSTLEAALKAETAPVAADQIAAQPQASDQNPPAGDIKEDIEPPAETLTEAPCTAEEPSIQQIIESAVTYPWDEKPQPESEDTTVQPAESEGDTQPIMVSAAAEAAPSPNAECRIDYCCLIIPRNGQVFLVRDLAEQLSSLLPEIHVENGWKLTSINIRPQYLLWTVSLPPDATPDDVVQAVKNRTENHIHANYPQYDGKENPESFWAEGYLALSGGEEPTRSMILDFQSRSRQPAN